MDIENVWKHISNKVANKVSDPFEDLHATVIPIVDGEFGELISSFTDEYEGDSYVMLKKLATEDVPRVPSTFAYFCPAKKRDTETGDVVANAVIFALVDKPMVEGGSISFGIWDLNTNEVDYNRGDDGEEWAGELPIALAALSLRAAIHNDEMGELGQVMKEALELAKESFLKFQEVMEKSAE